MLDRVGPQGDAPGTGVTLQPVQILVATALLGSVGVAEVNRRDELLSGGEVTCHLSALVQADRTNLLLMAKLKYPLVAR